MDSNQYGRLCILLWRARWGMKLRVAIWSLNREDLRSNYALHQPRPENDNIKLTFFHILVNNSAE